MLYEHVLNQDNKRKVAEQPSVATKYLARNSHFVQMVLCATAVQHNCKTTFLPHDNFRDTFNGLNQYVIKKLVYGPQA